MLSRRMFLKHSGGTALTLFVVGKFGNRTAIAQIPGGTLHPSEIGKFQAPLLVPAVMPKAGQSCSEAGKSITTRSR